MTTERAGTRPLLITGSGPVVDDAGAGCQHDARAEHGFFFDHHAFDDDAA